MFAIICTAEKPDNSIRQCHASEKVKVTQKIH